MVITLPTRQYMYVAINLFAINIFIVSLLHSYHWEREIALTISGKAITIERSLKKGSKIIIVKMKQRIIRVISIQKL